MITANEHTLNQAAEALTKHDPILAPNKNYYQELVESIISQQLSVKAAATILKRFIELFPGVDFPAPDQILQKDIEQLRAVGLSRQKASYIQDLALKVIEGEVRFNHLDALSNDEVIAELTRIKGVGVWTVHMFLMFCMGRLDILPTGDLGIKNGIHALYKLKEKPTPEEMEKIARENNWHPYETVASWYIWHSLDNKPVIS
jgi:DNA-3-methyladenine glycosylase II